MKIGICTDSGSGITPEEGKRLGITVVPMPFRMGEEEYFEDINMSREEFFKRLLSGESVSTSQPAMKSVLEAWDRLLEENEEVVHIPLSSGLSGSTQTAIMLSQDEPYLGRVYVPDSRGVSVTQRMHCVFAKMLGEKGYFESCTRRKRDLHRGTELKLFKTRRKDYSCGGGNRNLAAD